MDIIKDNIPPAQSGGAVIGVPSAGQSENERRHFDRILALALSIGAGLLSCGASVSRVEIAVKLICLSCGAKEVNVMSFPSRKNLNTQKVITALLVCIFMTTGWSKWQKK